MLRILFETLKDLSPGFVHVPNIGLGARTVVNLYDLLPVIGGNTTSNIAQYHIVIHGASYSFNVKKK